ncbi:MAG TPA: cysteine--1-D-myo-inosityl 2-amino-2-deoxy-alpha-D-glucopyranoside ligase, partial [Propionibacteriaceae bacterium]|nr:cysteine--1-D-myo-inosityl 2-amino-2-deoxy-alpha-D-glucopyranoside ligase [Propionibacteriaceae bacterium]
MRSWTSPTVPQLSLTSPHAPTRLTVHDTATRGPVEVGPAEGTARMYVCGITPYDATHLGHANTYLTFDLINRVWRDLGLTVTYAQNITDVDDPLLERAQQTGQDWEELASSQIDLFRGDMEALRVIPPDHYIGVVECVDCVTALIDELIERGFVYQIDDTEHPDWYFTSADAPGFMGISHLDHDAALAKYTEMGGDPTRPGKRHPFDCLVWMQQRPGEPAWDSRFGRGRPGWHIECTAIALKFLGADFDVQGGGSDLVFPHHEMSAAEGVAATG